MYLKRSYYYYNIYIYIHTVITIYIIREFKYNISYNIYSRVTRI